MRKRKKGKQFLIGLFVFVFTLVSVTGVSASASSVGTEEDSQEETLTKIYSSLAESGMESKVSAAIEDYTVETDIPVFMVLITDGEDGIITSAFYVRDTYGTGGTYLVTNGLVKVCFDEGYQIALVGSENIEQITEVYYPDESSYIAYIEAEMVKDYVPLEMAKEVSYTDPGLAFLELNGEDEFNLDVDSLDLSQWEKNGRFFYNEGEELGFEHLGMPLLDLSTLEVMGMFFADGDFHGIIESMTDLDFPEEAMIEQTEVEQDKEEEPVVSDRDKQQDNTEEESSEKQSGEEEQPLVEEEQPPVEQEQTEEETGSMVTFLGWIVGLLIGYFIVCSHKKKKKSKKSDADNHESGYYEGTIEMKEELQMPPTENITPVKSASWQLRGLGGTFAGQTFLLENSLLIGRNPTGQIVYPQNTKGISGTHCELAIENGQVVLRDLQSTYGTYFNHGIKLEARVPYQLKEGDSFYLAESAQAFRLERAGEYRQEMTPVVRAIGNPTPGAFYRAGLDEKMYFGQSPNCQVIFSQADSAISTIHCVLYKEGSNLYLMDLGSSNGTFLSDNNRLRPDVPYLVKKGSSFYLVSPNYTFVITED